MSSILYTDQKELKFCYEQAKKRCDLHKERAEKYKKIIREHPYFFDKEEDAIAFEIEQHKAGNYSAVINGEIGIDEEYFFIKRWYVAVDGRVSQAAEFIGLVFLSDYYMLRSDLEERGIIL